MPPEVPPHPPLISGVSREQARFPRGWSKVSPQQAAAGPGATPRGQCSGQLQPPGGRGPTLYRQIHKIDPQCTHTQTRPPGNRPFMSKCQHGGVGVALSEVWLGPPPKARAQEALAGALLLCPADSQEDGASWSRSRLPGAGGGGMLQASGPAHCPPSGVSLSETRAC